MAMDVVHRALPAALLCFLAFWAALGEARDHIVGHDRGWQVPANAGPDAHLNYTVWAASQVFLLNDDITFNYQRGLHTVFEVNYSTYVNCSFSMWSGNDWIYDWTTKTGKTKIVLNETRPYYFACGMSNHCQQGMKVGFNVTSNTTSLQEQHLSSRKTASNRTNISLAPHYVMPLSCTLLLGQALLFISLSLMYPPL